MNHFIMVLNFCLYLLLGQNKQSGVMIPLKALRVRHLNIFTDLDLPALGLGSRTLTASKIIILSQIVEL